MPGTSVAMGLKSPRISAGASGFRSKVPSCDGPPPMNSKMHDLALPPGERVVAAAARCRNNSGKARPAAPKPPTRRKSRREIPSQRRCSLPGIVSMTESSEDPSNQCFNRLGIIEQGHRPAAEVWERSQRIDAEHVIEG